MYSFAHDGQGILFIYFFLLFFHVVRTGNYVESPCIYTHQKTGWTATCSSSFFVLFCLPDESSPLCVFSLCVYTHNTNHIYILLCCSNGFGLVPLQRVFQPKLCDGDPSNAIGSHNGIRGDPISGCVYLDVNLVPLFTPHTCRSGMYVTFTWKRKLSKKWCDRYNYRNDFFFADFRWALLFLFLFFCFYNVPVVVKNLSDSFTFPCLFYPFRWW